jgi:glutamate dehydrogenase
VSISISTVHGLEEAFLSVWRGETDNDSYNRLVTNAGLSVREATVLRAYARYLRQAGIAYSQEYIALSLNRHSDIAAKLFELFRIRFDVALKEAKRTEQGASVIEAIETALAEVPSLDDDRILRRYVNAIESSLRTNYFQTGADGAPRPALAFKLDPKKLEGLARTATVPGDLRLWFGGRGRAPAFRPGCPRRSALVRPGPGLPHRSARPGQGAAGQECRHRAGWCQGRFLSQEAARRRWPRRGFRRPGDAYKLFIRTLLSVTDNIVGDGCAAGQHRSS